MEPITATWIAVIVFCAVLPTGTNVPAERRITATGWVVGIAVLFHVVFQGSIYRIDHNPAPGSNAYRSLSETVHQFQGFLPRVTYGSGDLRSAPVLSWYRVVTSNFVHYGGFPLVFHLWFIVLLGQVLEAALRLRRFVGLTVAGLVLPAVVEGLLPGARFFSGSGFGGGLSGLTATYLGAFVACYPRSRVYLDINYDLRFWAALLFLLFPITLIFQHAGLAFTETLMLLGLTAAFFLLSPDHVKKSAPTPLLGVYLLAFNYFIIRPLSAPVLTDSWWRIGGGVLTGLGAGYLLLGRENWNTRWGDITRKAEPGGSGGRGNRKPLAQLEQEGRKSLEGAKKFLGQRVFVGDAARASVFYKDVVMPRFPDLVLPMPDQMSLARMLHFRGLEKESLHAYRGLLTMEPLPNEYAVARLQAADMILRFEPERAEEARELLRRFENGYIALERDRMEARRLKELLPARLADPTPRWQYEQAAAPDAVQGTDYGIVTTDADADAIRLGERVLAVKRRRQQATDAAEFDFPRAKPVTFVYHPDGRVTRVLDDAPVKLDDLQDDPVYKDQWKALPVRTRQQDLPAIHREYAIKSHRVEDDDSTASPFYSAGGAPSTGGAPRGTGRLSRLELMKNDLVSKPAAQEMSTAYGSLSASAPEETATKETHFDRIRLKSDPPDAPLTTTPRVRLRRADAGGLAARDAQCMVWGERISLQSLPAEEASVDVGYSESDENILAVEESALWAVTLQHEASMDAVKFFAEAAGDLMEKYGRRDLALMTDSGVTPLFLLRGMPDVYRPAVEKSAADAQLPVSFLSEGDPLTSLAPVEVLGARMNASHCLMKTEFGNRHVAWNEIALVSRCQVRLAPNSRTGPRQLLEIAVLGATPTRFQLFQRTLQMKACAVEDKEYADPQEYLDAAWHFAGHHAAKAAIWPDRDSGVALHYESLAWYDEAVLRYLLANRRFAG